MPPPSVMHGHFGLSAGHSNLVPAPFRRSHQHVGIELNYLGSGRLTHRIAEREMIVPACTLTVFWAGFPHEVTQTTNARDFYWLHLPLELFLAWRLPERFRQKVLAGEVVMDLDPNRRPLDGALFQSWSKDLPASSGNGRRWALLEIEARLGRLADSVTDRESAPASESPGLGAAQACSVARLAQFVTEHYAERWRWQDAAQNAGLSPQLARRCFERLYGMTLHQYVLRLRLARAKQLLATADIKIVDVALESGFPTLSNFYRLFEAETQRTPSAFRKNCECQSKQAALRRKPPSVSGRMGP